MFTPPATEIRLIKNCLLQAERMGARRSIILKNYRLIAKIREINHFLEEFNHLPAQCQFRHRGKLETYWISAPWWTISRGVRFPGSERELNFVLLVSFSDPYFPFPLFLRAPCFRDGFDLVGLLFHWDCKTMKNVYFRLCRPCLGTMLHVSCYANKNGP